MMKTDIANLPKTKPVTIPKIIVGNWRMNNTMAGARKLTMAIVDYVGAEDQVSVVVCPPFPYLNLVGDLLKGSLISLGAQNLFPEKQGAFTGEVSPTMLLEVGCKYVILGHSERRFQMGESDMFINQKMRAALASGLNVIFCVGEMIDEHTGNETKTTLTRQLDLGLAGLMSDAVPHLTVAYEPIWALSCLGHHVIPEQVQEAHDIIRRRFGQLFGEESAETLSILYAGDVRPDNAAELFCRPGIDGALVGGASLDAGQFLSIIQVAIKEFQPEAV